MAFLVVFVYQMDSLPKNDNSVKLHTLVKICGLIRFFYFISLPALQPLSLMGRDECLLCPV